MRQRAYSLDLRHSGSFNASIHLCVLLSLANLRSLLLLLFCWFLVLRASAVAPAYLDFRRSAERLIGWRSVHSDTCRRSRRIDRQRPELLQVHIVPMLYTPRTRDNAIRIAQARDENLTPGGSFSLGLLFVRCCSVFLADCVCGHADVIQGNESRMKSANETG